jgi:osmoprotectant transport system ATP-binding protein
VRDVPMITDALTGRVDESKEALLKRFQESDWTSMLLLDSDGRPVRWLRPPDLRDERPLLEVGLPARAKVEPQATLSDALEEMLLGSAGVAIVVDGQGAFQGILDVDKIIESIQSMRDAKKQYYRATKFVDPDSVFA